MSSFKGVGLRPSTPGRFSLPTPPQVLLPDYWVDANGVIHRVLRSKKKFHKRLPAVAAIRAHVFTRDNFTCRDCGAKPACEPENFDGSEGIEVEGPHGVHALILDHVLSRRNGGTSHPDNLAARCRSCNSRKASLVDARHPVAVERRRNAAR